jgi:hypothetical protein
MKLAGRFVAWPSSASKFVAPVVLGTGLHAALPVPQGGDGSGCGTLQELIHEVYVFKPSQLSKEQQEERGAQMDRVWKMVENDVKGLAPCLRKELEQPNADAWFRVDGSALLVKVDPSKESKALQLRLWSAADLSDVAPAVWVPTLASLGAEGFDLSSAASRWLAGELSYFIPQHSLKVGTEAGALFLFGSMDEAYATPTLLKIVGDAQHPGRAVALTVLLQQATEDALRAIARLDVATFPEEKRAEVHKLLTKPELLRRKSPTAGLTRDKLTKAFEAFLGGDDDPLFATQITKDHKPVEDWPGQVVGLLKPEDIPLLRKVRRVRMTYQSDEALYDYLTYSSILMALTWKAELVK